MKNNRTSGHAIYVLLVSNGSSICHIIFIFKKMSNSKQRNGTQMYVVLSCCITANELSQSTGEICSSEEMYSGSKPALVLHLL